MIPFLLLFAMWPLVSEKRLSVPTWATFRDRPHSVEFGYPRNLNVHVDDPGAPEDWGALIYADADGCQFTLSLVRMRQTDDETLPPMDEVQYYPVPPDGGVDDPGPESLVMFASWLRRRDGAHAVASASAKQRCLSDRSYLDNGRKTFAAFLASLRFPLR
jgi:hypothetical protein